jgi:hypothetical protein
MLHTYIALIPGHGARVSADGHRAHHDPGARAVATDAEGRTETLIEEDRVRVLSRRLLSRLRLAGIPAGIHDAAAPSPDSDPARSYRRRCLDGVRAGMAAGADRVLVMHVHLNAGGGRYPLAVHHPGEDGTAAWCGHIEAALDALPGLDRRKGASTVVDFPRARGLIEAAWQAGKACAPKPVHAIVLEAAFLDTPAHWPLLTDGGLDLIADAVMAGLRAGGVV